MKQATWRKISEWPLLVAGILFLVAYSIEVIGDLSGTKALAFDIVIWATWVLFVADYLVNLVLAERRFRWFVRNMPGLAILALPLLRPLRLLRLVSMLHGMHNFAGHALRGKVILYAAGSAVLITYVGALAVLDAEQNVSHSNIRNLGDALWWAVVTIASVGYGDHYPVTLVGRLVAVGLMVGGIAVLGLVTATLASWLVEQVGVTAADVTRDAEAPLLRQLADMEAKLDRLTALLQADAVIELEPAADK